MAATVAALIAYAADRGTTIVDDAATAQALVRATDYIKHQYVSQFNAGYDITSENVEPAIYEGSILEAANVGFFSKTFTPADQKMLVEVKGIKWSPVGNASGASAATPKSTKIDAMLRPYMRSYFGIGISG